MGFERSKYMLKKTYTFLSDSNVYAIISVKYINKSLYQRAFFTIENVGRSLLCSDPNRDGTSDKFCVFLLVLGFVNFRPDINNRIMPLPFF